MNATDPSASMVASRAGARAKLLDEFEGAWRDGSPVFACCRRSVAAAVGDVDPHDLLIAGPGDRVRMLREPVEKAQPGHLEAHRCCANHLADLAFDAPELLAEPAHR